MFKLRINLRNLTLKIPSWTIKNGTMNLYIVLTEKQNLKKNEFSFSPESTRTVLREVSLSKYKLNSTNKFINLLDSSLQSEKSAHQKKAEKPVTHLLTRFNLFTMSSNINFDRNQVPQEIYGDLR